VRSVIEAYIFCVLLALKLVICLHFYRASGTLEASNLCEVIMAVLSKPETHTVDSSAAHRQMVSLPTSELVENLVEILGRKLTAYIGNVKDVRLVNGWINGSRPYKDAEERLKLAFYVAKTLREHDSAEVVQAWMIGMNPQLDDQVPLRLLREGELEAIGPDVLRAARIFAAGA
jgi:hypothetical protein